LPESGFSGLMMPCAIADSINYQEWDAAAGSYGPMTEARCEANGDVEI
jgi:hypothetical protein